jgi:hypothetical protein
MESDRTGGFHEENENQNNSNNFKELILSNQNKKNFVTFNNSNTINTINEVMREMDYLSSTIPIIKPIQTFNLNTISNNLNYNYNNFTPNPNYISQNILNINNDLDFLKETISRNIISNYTYNKYNNYGCTFTKGNDMISTGINTNSFKKLSIKLPEKNYFSYNFKNTYNNKLYNSQKVNSKVLYLSQNFAQTNIFS